MAFSKGDTKQTMGTNFGRGSSAIAHRGGTGAEGAWAFLIFGTPKISTFSTNTQSRFA